MKISDIERQWKDRPAGIVGDPRRFAVLVPLVERDGQAHLLFEVRADGMKHQPGEVCFPGGHMEPGERPLDCALRETREELNIPACAIRPIAELDTVWGPRGIIYPVLAQVEAAAVERLTASPAEVKETFLVPVEFFLTEKPRVYVVPTEVRLGEQEAEFNEFVGFPGGYPWRLRRETVPAWHYEGRVIWGLTGRILLWTFRKDEWK